MDDWQAASSGNEPDETSGETSDSLPEEPMNASGSASFSPGQVLLGRFRVVRSLGSGGMGDVYQAEDLELGPVALKTVRANLSSSAAMFQRFRQEVQLARKVSGPNVCRIFELFLLPAEASRGQRAFLTMELLDGGTLHDRLQQSPLPAAEAQRIALDICAGLEQIYRAGVLHRDLKPRNIMLAQREGKSTAVLTDFGLAAPLASGKALRENAMEGTPQYMAPEQFEGAELTAATDVYALGVVLFEMATGRRPFDGNTPMASLSRRAEKPNAEHAPPGWREIINCCLAYNPRERYQSAAQVAAALRRAGNPVARTAERTGKAAWRFRFALLVVLLCMSAWGGWRIAMHLREHVPPPAARDWYGKGVIALQEATYIKAIRALQMAVKLDPKYAMAHARLAEAWSELDFSGNSYQELQLARREAGNQRMSAHDKMQLAATDAVLARSYKEAEALQTEMLGGENDSRRAATLVDRGRTEQKDGEIAAALRDFEDAAKLAPTEPAAFVHIGILQVRHQHAQEAQSAFASAEQIYNSGSNQEGIAEVEFQQGYAADDAGNVDEANRHLQRALLIARQIESPQMEVRTLTQLSSVASYSTDQREAQEYAKQAIDLANANGLPQWAAAGYAKLGNSYLIAREDQVGGKAEQAYRQALQIADSSGQPRMAAQANIGLANIYIDDPEKASQYAQHAYDYYRQFGFGMNTQKALVLLARTQMAQGNLQGARQSSEELVKKTPLFHVAALSELAYNIQGQVFFATEQFPQAAEVFQQALSITPDSARRFELGNLASTEIRLGKFTEADRLLGDTAFQQSNLITQLRMEERNEQMQDKEVAMLAQSSALEDLRLEAKLAYATSLARLGRFTDAANVLKSVKATTMPGKATTDLSAAKIAWAQGSSQTARDRAAAALVYFQAHLAKVSVLEAASLAALASAKLGDHQAAKKYSHLAVDTRAELEHAWGVELYESFAVRPDVQFLARQLAATGGAN